ncbi:hypothetical protein DLP05_072 [Stenotrophomonas phage vB_SmaS_DLP_5]|uniref:Uncharacterized protein n=1 Tax=Stenotrophomonas phage vB_SmaS_DLP_5 TaxID=2044561 RepID=A0A2D2W2P6_9CAUD|nr:hypothetical protein FDJ07_gp149 [Stenotrophomonas phage vB_SmaS_DLP_5]ATS92414.1 hypothetical protein DLP05_072 [Stenotrophomonas phage vB_SmaS_DLP_5]
MEIENPVIGDHFSPQLLLDLRGFQMLPAIDCRQHPFNWWVD